MAAEAIDRKGSAAAGRRTRVRRDWRGNLNDGAKEAFRPEEEGRRESGRSTCRYRRRARDGRSIAQIARRTRSRARAATSWPPPSRRGCRRRRAWPSGRCRASSRHRQRRCRLAAAERLPSAHHSTRVLRLERRSTRESRRPPHSTKRWPVPDVRRQPARGGPGASPGQGGWPWPRRGVRQGCCSSSWKSTARPWRSRTACPCRGRVASDPCRRASWRPVSRLPRSTPRRAAAHPRRRARRPRA